MEFITLILIGTKMGGITVSFTHSRALLQLAGDSLFRGMSNK